MTEPASLSLHPLPDEVVKLVESMAVFPHLLAHLILVHDVAARLVEGLRQRWPGLRFNADDVLFGAAVHDIGKVLHPEEMVGPGQAHHTAGIKLLTTRGVSPERARFARTHATWEQEDEVQLEDLLVALADVAWAGGRDEALEKTLTGRLAAATGCALWEAYMDLDDLLVQVTTGAELRLVWQTQFAPLPKT